MSKKNENIIDKILNKKFETEYEAGYDPLDVDTFFDEIIECFKKILNENEKLKQEITNKDNTINSLINNLNKNAQEVKRLKDIIEEFNEDGYTNQSLIKEMSKLKEDIKNLKSNKNENN